MRKTKRPGRSRAIPAILRLHLIPQHDVTLKPENGPAQGWFLALARAWDPAWAKALHGGYRRPSYSLSPLYRAAAASLADEDCVDASLFADGCLRQGERVSLRLSLADDEQARRLLAALPHLRLPLLGDTHCRLARIPYSIAEDPDWLYAPWTALADAPPARRLHISFETPTTFSHQGESRLLPDPAHLLASWRAAWQYAPALPAGASGVTVDGLRVTNYSLHTEPLSLKGGLRIGFVGNMELTWRSGTSLETRRTFAVLAGLAKFLGTGAKTALGMGQTRVRM